MPQYYSIPDWNNRGKVTITPKSKWRQIPVIGKILPYYVGNKVEFTIHIDKPLEGDRTYAVGFNGVWEKIGSESKYIMNVNETETEIIGNPINLEGNVEYYLAYSTPSRGEPKITIFTAKAQNWDTVRTQWFFMIMAAIFGGVITLICGILLGLIQINPALTAIW